MTDAGRTWPLVGRDGELRLFSALLARPDANGIVLAGAPGVGKTRLAVECLALADAAGFPTARVTATRAATSVTFGALTPLLPVNGPVDETRLYQAALLRQASAALSARTGDRRPVLLVDNANLLDDASATLLHQLAVTGSAFLILTLRAREPAPDTVLRLWKDGLADRVEVHNLDGEAITELLGQVVGGPVDRAAVARLAARSGGDLLFLRELVLGALATGVLIDEGGLWRLVGPLATTQRIVELVETRLSDLDPADRAFLEAVAVGEPLGAAEIAALGCEAQAARLESLGLLSGGSDGWRLSLRLAHPLYGEVLRRGIPALRRRAVARTLVETVEATGARRHEDGLRVAAWRLEAGGATPDNLLAAAELARRAYDLALAERLARAAAEAGGGFPARLLAASLAGLQGREDLAETELAELDGSTEDAAERAQLAVARVDNLRFLGRSVEARPIADAALEVLPEGPGRDEVAARRAGVVLELDGPEAAVASTKPLRKTAGPGALAWSGLMAAHALVRTGRLSEAMEAARSGDAAYRAAGEDLRWPHGVLALAQADAARLAGRLSEAEALTESQYRDAISGGLINLQGYAAWQMARVAVDQGKVETAARYGREAVTLLRSLGRRALLRDALVPLALAEALARRTAHAAETLAELDGMALEPSRAAPADLGCARAWAAVATGDIPSAKALLAAAAESSDQVGDRVGVVVALHDLARLGEAKGVAKRLALAAEGVEGEVAPARVAHVAALAAGDAHALELAASSFATLGLNLLAAEAAADAAVAWRRQGNPKAAAAAQRSAEEHIASCEGAVTPALRALEARAMLSPSEREAALLAAAGRSNRDIATDLGLSVRTVENRLQRVYDKLGISGRTELAEAMER